MTAAFAIWHGWCYNTQLNFCRKPENTPKIVIKQLHKLTGNIMKNALVIAFFIFFSTQTYAMNSTEIASAYTYLTAFAGYMFYHFFIKTEDQSNEEKYLAEQHTSERNIRAGIRFKATSAEIKHVKKQMTNSM